MDYAKYIKGVSGFNALRVAVWAVLIAAVIVAGIAALSAGLS
jgi:Flp pilus assembly pilin Flp